MILILLIPLYSLIIILFLGGSSIIFLFIFLEMLSWVFTILMPTFISIKYLIIQAYFIILGLVGLLWVPIFLFFRLLLKIGLPPIHIWFIKLSFFIRKWIFLLFSTIHKLLPLLLIGSLLLRSNVFLMVLLIIAGRLIFQVFELFFVLLASSIIHRSWTLLSIQFNLKLGLRYWVLYSLVFILLLSTIYFLLLFKRGVEQSSSTVVMWLVLSGLPPFVMFWLKVWIFLLLVQIRLRLRLILVLISVLALTRYFRAFHTRLRLTYFSGFTSVFFTRLAFISFI